MTLFIMNPLPIFFFGKYSISLEKVRKTEKHPRNGFPGSKVTSLNLLFCLNNSSKTQRCSKIFYINWISSYIKIEKKHEILTF